MSPSPDDNDTPRSMSGLPAGIRLEMLVGCLADQLALNARLVAALRLQSSASVTTRGKLEHLIGLTGALWETHNRIREEAAAIVAAGETSREGEQ